jgi:hypothetical protein
MSVLAPGLWPPRSRYDRKEFGDAGLDACRQYVKIGRRGVVAGDPEGHLAVVGEDRDSDAHGCRDGHVGDHPDQSAAEAVERLLRPWDIRGDRDDLPLRNAEDQAHEHRRERGWCVPAERDKRLAGLGFAARLQRCHPVGDDTKPCHRVGNLDRKVGHQCRQPVLVTAFLALVPDRDGNQRRNHAGLRVLSPGHQQGTETAADRGQEHVVHGAAEFVLDRLDVAERRSAQGVTALPADGTAQG